LRKDSVPEALAVFALIMLYIWKLRLTHPWSWLAAVALIVVSHVARRERPQELGFHTRNFAICARKFGLAVIAAAAALWIGGLLLKTIRPLSPAQMIQSFAVYLPWGLFQQYLMNGYFLRRFDSSLSRGPASVLTAVLFSVVHAPNWFLMLVTPVGACGAIWVYRRYGNLYFLGLAHAVFGFLLFIVVPDSVSHHMRVGPGWFSYR